MSLSGKLVFEQEISSPGILFFEIYCSKKQYLPIICPDKLPSIELLEGNWGEVGCKLLVNYLIDGKLIPVKETIETVDEDNRSMTHRILEGDLLKDYKSLLITFQATSKGEKNFLNWTYEYEKQNLDVPAPDHMFDFASEVSNKLMLTSSRTKIIFKLDTLLDQEFQCKTSQEYMPYVSKINFILAFL